MHTMKYKDNTNCFAIFLVISYFVQIFCEDVDTGVLSTLDYPRRYLPLGLINDKDSEEYCESKHIKCLDNNRNFKLIGAWDIFNSKWKFHTLCEIKNSRCLLDKAAYRYNNSGYNTWILV